MQSLILHLMSSVELSINRSQFDVVSSVVQSIRGTVDEVNVLMSFVYRTIS